MNWRSVLLLSATLCLSPGSALAQPSPALAPLHQAFAAHDQRITQQHSNWQGAYQQALTLAKSDQPARALPAFEALLDGLAEQEVPFSRVYARYFTLAEQLDARPRSATFLQQLSQRYPTPWVLGAWQETQAKVTTREQAVALLDRLEARRDAPALADDMAQLYLLLWANGTPGEAGDKSRRAEALISSLPPETDSGGIRQLAQWRYRGPGPLAAADPGQWQAPLTQALARDERSAIVSTFSHYLAALIATNQLPEGQRWAQARLAAGDRRPALAMIADILTTLISHQTQRQQALASIGALRQQAPDSLLLALTESSLKFEQLDQGYLRADQVLVEFGRRLPHDQRVQTALQFHRAMLARWAEGVRRAKRDLPTFTGPDVVVTATRYPVDSFRTEINLQDAYTPRNRRGEQERRSSMIPVDCASRGAPQNSGQLVASLQPVAGVLPKVMSKLPKAKSTNVTNSVGSSAENTAKGLNEVLSSRNVVTENITSRGTVIQSVPNGTMADALADFSALSVKNSKVIATPKGQVRMGELPDGSTVKLRPSNDGGLGRPTIEVVGTNGRTVKEVRYGNNN